MLCVNKYPQDYVDRRRSRVKQQLGVYNDLIVAATKGNESKGTKISAAVECLEPVFFNNMVLVLDTYFVHRSRTMEGKDGNALNEVRVLCNSILENHSVLRVDKTIKINPDASVLKLKPGDPIALRLSKAFFAEIERKFME